MVRLREEVDREREERNFFQLERDKVNTFWDITKRQLEESKATVRNKERELEDSEEKHQVEIKVNCDYTYIRAAQWQHLVSSFTSRMFLRQSYTLYKSVCNASYELVPKSTLLPDGLCFYIGL